ncbi:MAG: Lanthionine biosynthesis cyclase LanC, partial [Acidobacteriota bacterium]|nr:Lanthionine biosynthesis cyclase LanC [Acidobacteriota bacterium]
IARAAAARLEETAGVRDAGLCHGAAGLAHLFNRMYQTSGVEELGTAARRWFDKTLDYRRPGEGVGGFLAFDPSGSVPGAVPGAAQWRSDPNFLEGSAGVGLALLGAVSTVEPAWDRLLLASLPAPSGP